jgi:Fe-S-cluster-containing hydrogenase component 2
MDDVAARIIGLKTTEVPTIIKSKERGLLEEEIHIVGASLSEVLVKDFYKPTRQFEFNFYNLFLPKFLRKGLERYIKPRPVFKTKHCISCGACTRSCPPGAITMVEGKPELKLDKCIRCFCCHELCNYEAIKIKKPWFLKGLLH